MDNKTLYEKFLCIGGQCPLTCCKGWEITVDPETYDKWKDAFVKTEHVRYTVSKKKSSDKTEYKINMGQVKSCPYFNEDGLCRIVLYNGEDYLPSICRQFPRIINEYKGIREKSLSCACPEVIDLLHREGEKLQLFSWDENETDGDEFPLKGLRKVLLSILTLVDFTLKDRLLLGLIILSEFMNKEINTRITFENLCDEGYLASLLRLWRDGEPNIRDACLEQNELFLDIAENYRKENYYIDFLEPLASYAENLDVQALVKGYREFEDSLYAYDWLLEQCLQIKVFSECIGDETGDLLQAFQMIILEYTMVRHSVYLITLMRGYFDYEDVRNYIVIYSRIIGNNPEGIKEFFQDSFDGGIWDPSYFLLLLNQNLY